MKKEYTKPAMRMVCIQHASIICTSINGNANLRFGGGNSGVARVREQTDWTDDGWDD